MHTKIFLTLLVINTIIQSLFCSQNNTLALESFSEEILLHIFQQCDVKSYANLSCTSHQFFKISGDKELQILYFKNASLYEIANFYNYGTWCEGDTPKTYYPYNNLYSPGVRKQHEIVKKELASYKKFFHFINPFFPESIIREVYFMISKKIYFKDIFNLTNKEEEISRAKIYLNAVNKDKSYYTYQYYNDYSTIKITKNIFICKIKGTHNNTFYFSDGENYIPFTINNFIIKENKIGNIELNPTTFSLRIKIRHGSDYIKESHDQINNSFRAYLKIN